MILKNRNILVTGGGKGIGFSTILQAIKEGAFVYTIIRSKQDLRKFKNISNVKVFVGDVSNTNLINRIFTESLRSKKIITGNSGILFESLFLKKTTFLWAENVENKFESINDKDRYGVLKNNYCLELNSENIEKTVIKDHRLSNEQYNMLFPIGLNEKNEKLFISKDKGIK